MKREPQSGEKILYTTNLIMALPAHKRLADYPPVARALVAVEWSSGTIDNGGFTYGLGSQVADIEDFALAAESYRTLGLESVARAIESVLSLFPKHLMPSDSKARLEFIASLGEKGESVMSASERTIFSLTDTITDAMFKHARQHEAEIKQLAKDGSDKRT